MKTLPLPRSAALRCFLVAALALILPRAAVGQTSPIYLPPDANVLNVKLPPYNAAGDGVTDDTAAIQAALTAEFAYELGDAGANNGDFPRPKVVYLPAGTYLVSDTLKWRQTYYDGNTTVRGQGPAFTTIRLKNAAAGFNDPANPKAVLRTRGGNQSFNQYIWDLTVNTGTGNPGASGLDWISNNLGSVRRVTVRSGDGQGATGLDMTRQWPGPCIATDVRVEGFDYGVRVNQGEYGPVFERITVNGQRVCGFFNGSNCTSIRGLTSAQTGAVPALRNAGGSCLVLLDLVATGGAAGVSAVENGPDVYSPYLYARNLSAAGSAYDSVLRSDGSVVPGGLTLPGEWTSRGPVSAFPNAGRSLNLPIAETPAPFQSGNPADWARFTNTGDVAAAFAAGRPIVYCPRGFPQYIAGTISVPATVRRIVGFELSNRETLVLDVDENTTEPLVIEGFQALTVNHRSNRPIVFLDTAFTYRDFPGCGNLFVDDGITDQLDLRYPAKVWARQLNIEGPQVKVRNHGVDAWVFGLKTEGTGTIINTSGNGRTEMLGTLLYPAQSFAPAVRDTPAVIDNEAAVSVIYGGSSYVANGFYTTQVREIRDGVVNDYTPLSGRVLPLYVGWQTGGPTGTSRPEVTPNGANFTGSQLVTAIADTPGSVLRYTVNGTDPDAASPVFPAATGLTLTTTTTLRLRAFAPGRTPSAVATATFTRLPLLPALQPVRPSPGVAYEYYQGSFGPNLPDFSTLTPTATGVVPSFSLAPRQRDQNFAFRFEALVFAPADGLYTFGVGSDDGSRLLVDGQTVADNDGAHGYYEATGQVGLAAGQHRVTVLFYQGGGDFGLGVFWSGPGFSRQDIPDATLVARAPENPLPALHGLDYAYYETAGGSAVPDFSTLTPVKTGVGADFSLAPRNRDTAFAFRFTGYVDIPVGGPWTFFTDSDDGSLLFLGNTLVVNNDGGHAMQERAGTLTLAPGRHALTVAFAQGGAGYGLAVSYAGPDTAKQPIPAGALFVTDTPFAGWLRGNFTPAELAAPAVSAPLADPDADGLDNLLEYALALSPKAPSAAGAPRVGRVTPNGSNQTFLTLTFTRVKAATDLVYLPEVSGDLTAWTSGPGATVETSVVDQGATEAVTVRDLSPLTGAGRRFIRLRVTTLP